MSPYIYIYKLRCFYFGPTNGQEGPRHCNQGGVLASLGTDQLGPLLASASTVDPPMYLY